MPVCPTCEDTNPKLGAKCPRCETYYIYEDALDDAERDKYIGTLAADKYVVLSHISEGGMGTIYRALQLPVEREVALKVLRTELEDNDEVRKRFVREARAVSALTHPNIITLHDFGFDKQEHPYMVMEYAPGDNLDEWMTRGDLTLDRVLGVTRQILSALSDAHDEGIIHRDLKPENMIVTDAGAQQDFVKLLDFGIARLVNQEATQGLTREGEVFGTPHYMAPEQAQGETGIGAPADVYAMGIIMYEMISGETPFDAPTPLAILFKQINEDVPPLQAKNGWTLPDWVATIVERATRKDPDQRYQTAGEMFDALDAGLEKGELPESAKQPAASGGSQQSATLQPQDAQTPAGGSKEGSNTALQYGGSAKPDDKTAESNETAAAASSSGSVTQAASRDTPGAQVEVEDPDPSDSWFGETAQGLQPWYESDNARRIAIFAALIGLAGILAVVALTLTPTSWGEDSAAVAANSTDASTGSSADTGKMAKQAPDAGTTGTKQADEKTGKGQNEQTVQTSTTDQAGGRASDEAEQATGGTEGGDEGGAKPTGTGTSDPGTDQPESIEDEGQETVEWPGGDDKQGDDKQQRPGHEQAAGATESDQTGDDDQPSTTPTNDQQDPTTAEKPSEKSDKSTDESDKPTDDSESDPERFGSPDEVPTKWGAPDDQ